MSRFDTNLTRQQFSVHNLTPTLRAAGAVYPESAWKGLQSVKTVRDSVLLVRPSSRHGFYLEHPRPEASGSASRARFFGSADNALTVTLSYYRIHLCRPEQQWSGSEQCGPRHNVAKALPAASDCLQHHCHARQQRAEQIPGAPSRALNANSGVVRNSCYTIYPVKSAQPLP